MVPVITALYIAYDPIKKLGGINNKIKEALLLQRLNEILHAKETVTQIDNPSALPAIERGSNLNLYPLHTSHFMRIKKRIPPYTI